MHVFEILRMRPVPEAPRPSLRLRQQHLQQRVHAEEGGMSGGEGGPGGGLEGAMQEQETSTGGRK